MTGPANNDRPIQSHESIQGIQGGQERLITPKDALTVIGNVGHRYTPESEGKKEPSWLGVVSSRIFAGAAYQWSKLCLSASKSIATDDDTLKGSKDAVKTAKENLKQARVAYRQYFEGLKGPK